MPIRVIFVVAEMMTNAFPGLTKYLAQRFGNISIELLLDFQRVPIEQYSQVMNLALDAPDLAGFQQKLKEWLNS